METRYVIREDGTRIAYDVTGNEMKMALALLHGAGKTRHEWHTAGYIDRLRDDFQIISIDMRGAGQSDFCTEITDYAIGKLIGDIHAIADACLVDRFMVCGYSFGGNIARYLGAFSDRVEAVVTIGAPLGSAIDDRFGLYIDKMLQKWEPIVNAYKAGALQGEELAQTIKAAIPVWAACFQAMRNWPKVDPGDLHCPALLVAGSNNTPVVEWVAANYGALNQANLQIVTLDGLDHAQEFTEIDKVLPPIIAFLKAHNSSRSVNPA
jgi:pimeloyl-ACP methyl ester carboxylesterase